MQLTLNPGEKKQIPLEHRYLRVLQASGAFEISAPGVNAFLLRNRQSADLEQPRTVTILNNNSTVLTVEIESAPFKVSEIDAVSIADLPPIEIAPNQAIQTAEVGFPVGANLAVNNFPASQVVEGALSVNNFPISQVVEGTLAVNNFPASQVVEGALSVNNFPTEFGVKVKNSLIGLSPITFDTNLKTVAGSTARKELHIQSDPVNTGLIYLGSLDGLTGIPIEAGQTVVIEITSDLNLYANTIGSIVNLCEVV